MLKLNFSALETSHPGYRAAASILGLLSFTEKALT
jgi:hypothetical protein